MKIMRNGVERDATPQEQAAILAAQAEAQNQPKYPDADAAKSAMFGWITSFTASVTGLVPIDERLSWDAKEAAARAYVALTADVLQTAMIEDEAEITGEVPADLAAIIIARADLFRAIAAKAAGLRRKTITAIDAVTDPADYEVVLLAAKADAVTLAESLGITVSEAL